MKEIFNTETQLSKYEYEDFLEEWNIKYPANDFVLFGTSETWQGSFPFGFVFESIGEVFDKFNGYTVIVEENKGHLYITVPHHDGINNYEIRKLTIRGEKYLERHEYDNQYKLHKKLFEYPYSILPRYLKTI